MSVYELTLCWWEQRATTCSRNQPGLVHRHLALGWLRSLGVLCGPLEMETTNFEILTSKDAGLALASRASLDASRQ